MPGSLGPEVLGLESSQGDQGPQRPRRSLPEAAASPRGLEPEMPVRSQAWGAARGALVPPPKEGQQGASLETLPAPAALRPMAALLRAQVETPGLPYSPQNSAEQGDSDVVWLTAAYCEPRLGAQRVEVLSLCNETVESLIPGLTWIDVSPSFSLSLPWVRVTFSLCICLGIGLRMALTY